MIESIQSDLEGNGEKLRAITKPLSEIQVREVATLEIKEVKSEEEALLEDLEAIAASLVPLDERIASIDDLTKGLVSDDKDDRLACA